MLKQTVWITLIDEANYHVAMKSMIELTDGRDGVILSINERCIVFGQKKKMHYA